MAVGGNFVTCEFEFSQVAKFCNLANFLQAPISLHFLLFFPFGFLSTMLSSTRILRAWINSTILA